MGSVSRGVSESRTRDQSVFRAKLNKLFIVGRHDACFTPFRFRSEPRPMSAFLRASRHRVRSWPDQHPSQPTPRYLHSQPAVLTVLLTSVICPVHAQGGFWL